MDFRLEKNDDWRNKRTVAWRPLGLTILRTRQRPEKEKAGRLPVREIEGPAKNLLLRRTKKRPARYEETMVLAGISFSRAKELIINLAGFRFLLLKYG